MREKSMTWLVGSCKAKEIRESPGRGTVAISALGLMVLVALLPAVDAAQGGGGNGGENCTWDVEKIGSPRKPGYTEVTTIYCDNPFAGSTDCSPLGQDWTAIEWAAGKRPDYNGDGTVCSTRHVLVYR